MGKHRSKLVKIEEPASVRVELREDFFRRSLGQILHNIFDVSFPASPLRAIIRGIAAALLTADGRYILCLLGGRCFFELRLFFLSRLVCLLDVPLNLEQYIIALWHGQQAYIWEVKKWKSGVKYVYTIKK